MRTKLLLCVWLSLASLAVAQESEEPSGKPVQSVFVRDSGVASEKLSLAAKLERQKQWDRAADVYQEVATKYADRVLASKTDASGQPSQYVSAAIVVQDKLAAWPAEGVAAYRRRFEDAARDLLGTSPTDLAAARKTLTLHFVTDAGRDAGLRLMAAAFERGDFATVASTGRRLLDRHPNVVAERPRVLLQTALAEHLVGKTDAAAKTAAELKARFPNATATVAGADADLAKTLDDALKRPPVAATAVRSDDWPAPFGNASASLVPDRISEGGAKLFSYEYAASRRRISGLPTNANRFQKDAQRDRPLGYMTGVFPAIDGSDLFFQDNARVYAVSLTSGQPLPGWAATYPADRGAYTADAMSMPRGKQMTVSVAGDRVVALVAQNDADAMMNSVAQTVPRVVCLDRDTGRRLWDSAPTRLKLGEDLAGLRTATLYGSPVVVDDAVYALAHSARGGQFDETYLLALNLSDGAFRWATYVASTSLGGRFGGFDTGEFTSDALAQVSAADGRLYVTTNLGAVACVDAADGHVVWLNLYPRDTGGNGQAADRRVVLGLPQSPRVKPFTVEPPVISGGRVFVLPSDGRDLLVYDAATGDLVRSLPRQFERRFAPVETLLAVVGDTVVLAGPSTLYRVPWQTYDPTKSLLENNGIDHVSQYRNITPSDSDDKDGSLRGRSFVSGKYIVSTTAERLYRHTLDSLKVVSNYPAQGKWDDEESPGNVLATPDHLIIAGPTRISAYADLSVATGKLDARLAADPDDLDAHLRYAELLLAANRPADALARLDAAAGRLGTPMRAGPDRTRLYTIAMAAAARTGKPGGDAAMTVAYFDRAATAADGAAQQVQYRLARAADARRRNDTAAELALYQQVLSTADWRAAPVAGASGLSTGGTEAEAGAAELLRQYGRPVYAAYADAAAARLSELNKADPADPDALVAVADEYPLADAANEALSLAADRFEEARRPRLATQTLRRLLKRNLSNERRNAVLQAMARNYLAVPGQLDTAAVRLAQARDFVPSGRLIKPLTLPDGRTIDGTLADATTALDLTRLDAAERLLPAWKPGGATTRPAAGVAQLAPAVDVVAAAGLVAQQADAVRHDRVVTFGLDRRVSVTDAATHAARPTDAVLPDSPTGCAFNGDTLVVVGPQAVVGIGGDGKALWTATIAALPPVDVVPAGAADTADEDDDPAAQAARRVQELRNRRVLRRFGRINAVPAVVRGEEAEAVASGAEQFTAFRMLSDRVVLATSTGRLLALEPTTGHALWQSRPSDRPVRHLVSCDDFVAVSYVADGQTAADVYALDAADGRPVLHQTHANDNQPQVGPFVNLALAPNGTLVTLLAGRITARDLYDPSASDRKWPDGNVVVNPGDQPFVGSTTPGQIAFAAGRVLAVYRQSNGFGQQMVRVLDLASLKPVQVAEGKGRGIPELTLSPYIPDTNELAVRLVTSGPRVYVTGPRSLAGYNLAHPDEGWNDGFTKDRRGLGEDLILTRDYAVSVTQRGVKNAAATVLPAVQLWMFSRAVLPDSGRESGRLEYNPVLSDPSGVLVDQWQMTDGAFYYVTADQRLKVIRPN